MDPLTKPCYIDFHKYIMSPYLYLKFDNNNINEILKSKHRLSYKVEENVVESELTKY